MNPECKLGIPDTFEEFIKQEEEYEKRCEMGKFLRMFLENPYEELAEEALQ